MPFNPASPITGATVTGLTTPTYTLTTDVAPSMNGKQYAISALGGTQANVDVNSVSKPFTMTFYRPQSLRTLPAANPVTGVLKNVPVNTYKLLVRKGALPSANQVAQIARVTIAIDVPAGTDTFEPEELRALVSCAAGAFFSNASSIVDTMLTGTM